jgi:branched-chain amino acid transport system permease protein
LRIRGIYLAIATLAAAELITLFFSHFQLTGGVMGYTGMPYLEVRWLLVLTLAILAVSIWIYHSRLGKAMQAVGSDPVVAACNGINVPFVQLLSLGIGGAFAGLAGACFAHFYSFIAPANFAFHRTVDILMFLVTGGLTPLGALVGSTVLTLVPQYVTVLERWAPAVYGVIVMIMMAWMPSGLLPPNRLSRWRIRRHARSALGSDVFRRPRTSDAPMEPGIGTTRRVP